MRQSEIPSNINPCSFFADGQYVPDLLTPQEAIKYLRLDVDGPNNPEMTLDYYRREGLLKATRVGKRIRYTKSELMVLLENLTNRTNEDLS